MNCKYSIYVLLFVFAISCSSSTEPDDGTISVKKANSELIISNNTNRTLYLHLVEQKIAALINWAPHFNEPKIERGGLISIDYENIFNGSTEPVMVGNKIIIYYWDDSDQSQPDIQNILVEL